jgi:hypothetical protein
VIKTFPDSSLFFHTTYSGCPFKGLPSRHDNRESSDSAILSQLETFMEAPCRLQLYFDRDDDIVYLPSDY